MEYIYGTITKDGVTVETLKTIGAEHSNLEGFASIMREYPDGNITDNFNIVEKYHSDEDTEGNCYDWYEICNHYRYVDRTKIIPQPYKATQTAYYGEKEKNFYNVPQGILTVYFDNYTGSYSVERIDDRLTVSFDTLENDTNITIIVQ